MGRRQHGQRRGFVKVQHIALAHLRVGRARMGHRVAPGEILSCGVQHARIHRAGDGEMRGRVVQPAHSASAVISQHGHIERVLPEREASGQRTLQCGTVGTAIQQDRYA